MSQALAFALRSALEGEVRFDAGSRHLYATEASNYRQVPIGVVLPRTVEDVVETVRICREHGVPITSRGGGTSLAGQTTNVAVIIDFSRHLDRVLEIDPAARIARVQPGVVLDDLRRAAQEHGLTFGPDPSTHDRCTLGGMIGNNACGMHSLWAGRTEDNVHALDVLLYDGTRLDLRYRTLDEMRELAARDDRVGEVHRGLLALRDEYATLVRERYPDIPRRVSGYNLPELLGGDGIHTARALVGTEGTCGIVLEATVELRPSPPARSTLVLAYPSIAEAGDHVPAILDSGCIALEGIDEQLTGSVRAAGLRGPDGADLPDGDGWLLLEFGGETQADADGQARALVDRLTARPDAPQTVHYTDPADAVRLWQVRESGLGAAFGPGREARWPGWEDAAVPPERVGAYLRDFRDLLDAHDLRANLYGHFGDGCIHCRISFDLTSADGVEAYRRFTDEAADLVLRYGGSLSGEHGDGQARGDLLGKMFGDELVDAFRRFKGLFDPDGLMNPGKVVDPHSRTADLRLGPDYAPWEPETVFHFPDDDHRFSRATLRCIGIGRCRRDDGHGTMCPSYMVTHDEQHSTRGRARLLFEMLQPDADLDGWRDASVADALDLCLSCKACQTECPAEVDIATYKAEFGYHHWKGRVRPRSHYALGLVRYALRGAAWVPGLANTLLKAPVVSDVVKRAAGVARERPAPPVASPTFRDWYARRGSLADPGAEPVLLFPDTFTDHLEPQVAQAAVRVLEHAGYRVVLPPPVCCGRPLYDHGMLDLAQRHLDQLVDTFRDHVRAGGYVVGLEPSCIAVFRDELCDLRHEDADALLLADRTLTFAEFLVDVADHHPARRLRRKAIVQRHCHQAATAGFAADSELYDRLGLDWEFLDSGCCGLAGSFGFTAGDRYDVSVAAGERVLLPAVRAADPATLVLADGFSCRAQISHLQDDRRALHLAEVLDLTLRGDVPDDRPERGVPVPDARRLTPRDAAVLGAVGAAVAGIGALLWRGGRRRGG